MLREVAGRRWDQPKDLSLLAAAMFKFKHYFRKSNLDAYVDSKYVAEIESSRKLIDQLIKKKTVEHINNFDVISLSKLC